MQENSPITLFFQKENRFPAGDGLIQSVSRSSQRSRPLPRPAGYTDLPESTGTVSKTCLRAELLAFPHIPQQAENNKGILLSNDCCYTDESLELWRGLRNEWEAEQPKNILFGAEGIWRHLTKRHKQDLGPTRNSNSVAGSSFQYSWFWKTGLCVSQIQLGSIVKRYLGSNHDTGHCHAFTHFQKISKTSVEQIATQS